MNNILPRLPVVFCALGLAALGGCASAPTSNESAATPVAQEKTADQVALADTQEQPAVATGRAADGPTIFSEETVASMTDDDFWRIGDPPTVGDDGRLVYKLQPPVIEDATYNRRQLYERSAPQAQYYYDPVTGYAISRQQLLRYGARAPEGRATPRPVTPGLEPAPRVRTPAAAPRRVPAPSPRRRPETFDDRR